ncbi:MAG: class I SAM-dependent methyltransferase [Deltaproteobacteria bacterium]
MRQLVGPTDTAEFDNPSGAVFFDDMPLEAWESVVDFGCGCGRIARRLILQDPRPERYVGVDLHRGMVGWCQENLAPAAPGFSFHHHDVHNLGFNPGSRVEHAPLPVADASATLLIAWSVFTHITERSAEFYLDEVARVLADKGVARTTWFLFDKNDFPMMQKFQNALFINDIDPSNAVIFDRMWLQNQASRVGLQISKIVPPELYGYQWVLDLRKAPPGAAHVEFPTDAAPRGMLPPPLSPENADKIR